MDFPSVFSLSAHFGVLPKIDGGPRSKLVLCWLVICVLLFPVAPFTIYLFLGVYSTHLRITYNHVSLVKDALLLFSLIVHLLRIIFREKYFYFFLTLLSKAELAKRPRVKSMFFGLLLEFFKLVFIIGIFTNRNRDDILGVPFGVSTVIFVILDYLMFLIVLQFSASLDLIKSTLDTKRESLESQDYEFKSLCTALQRAKIINQLYGPQILLTIPHDFISLLSGLFSIYVGLKELRWDAFFKSAFNAVKVMIISFKLLVMTGSCEQFTNSVSFSSHAGVFFKKI